jgi:nucleoside-diphosphate kinase
MKMIRIDVSTAKRHYAEHEGKPFFQDLVAFITSGPVVAFVLEGQNVIEGVRQIMGKTNPKDSPIGTIRGDLGIDMSHNVVHGSDSTTSAIREISIFFKDSEILSYDRQDEVWLYP